MQWPEATLYAALLHPTFFRLRFYRYSLAIFIGQTMIARHRQALRGERFVEFDDVHLREFEAGFFQHLLACEAHK